MENEITWLIWNSSNNEDMHQAVVVSPSAGITIKIIATRLNILYWYQILSEKNPWVKKKMVKLGNDFIAKQRLGATFNFFFSLAWRIFLSPSNLIIFQEFNF